MNKTIKGISNQVYGNYDKQYFHDSFLRSQGIVVSDYVGDEKHREFIITFPVNLNCHSKITKKELERAIQFSEVQHIKPFVLINNPSIATLFPHDRAGNASGGDIINPIHITCLSKKNDLYEVKLGGSAGIVYIPEDKLRDMMLGLVYICDNAGMETNGRIILRRGIFKNGR